MNTVLLSCERVLLASVTGMTVCLAGLVVLVVDGLCRRSGGLPAAFGRWPGRVCSAGHLRPTGLILISVGAIQFLWSAVSPLEAWLTVELLLLIRWLILAEDWSPGRVVGGVELDREPWKWSGAWGQILGFVSLLTGAGLLSLSLDGGVLRAGEWNRVAGAGCLLSLTGLAIRMELVPFHSGGSRARSTASAWARCWDDHVQLQVWAAWILRNAFATLPGSGDWLFPGMAVLMLANLGIGSFLLWHEESLRRRMEARRLLCTGAVLFAILSTGFRQVTAREGALLWPIAAVMGTSLSLLGCQLSAICARCSGQLPTHLEQWRGRARQGHVTAVLAAASVAGLAGLPPLAGYWVRMQATRNMTLATNEYSGVMWLVAATGIPLVVWCIEQLRVIAILTARPMTSSQQWSSQFGGVLWLLVGLQAVVSVVLARLGGE